MTRERLRVSGVPNGFMAGYHNVVTGLDHVGYSLGSQEMGSVVLKAGSFTWEIPLQFTTGNGSKLLSFKITQLMTIDETGKACVTKGNSDTVCKELDDDSVP